MSTTKRNRGRPRRDQGPAVDIDALLDLAAQSFASQGYDATSIRKLARDANISHSLAHHYFDTKLDLWKACIDRGFGNISREMTPMLQAAIRQHEFNDSVRETIENYVVLTEKFSDYILILLQEASRGGERFDYMIERYFENFTPLAHDLYQQSVDAGILRPIPWPTIFSMLLLGAPARFALQPLMEALSKPGDAKVDARQHAQDVAELVLKGLLPSQ